MVWPGYQLLDYIDAKFTAVQGSTATVSADATGYAAPKVSTATIRAQLAGLGLSDAYGRIRQDFPGSSAPFAPFRSSFRAAHDGRPHHGDGDRAGSQQLIRSQESGR